jgi:hypothetical protein
LQDDDPPAPGGWGGGPQLDDPLEQYSEQTRRSLAVVDESILNYELLEALVCHIVGQAPPPLPGTAKTQLATFGFIVLGRYLPGLKLAIRPTLAFQIYQKLSEFIPKYARSRELPAMRIYIYIRSLRTL